MKSTQYIFLVSMLGALTPASALTDRESLELISAPILNQVLIDLEEGRFDTLKHSGLSELGLSDEVDLIEQEVLLAAELAAEFERSIANKRSECRDHESAEPVESVEEEATQVSIDVDVDSPYLVAY